MQISLCQFHAFKHCKWQQFKKQAKLLKMQVIKVLLRVGLIFWTFLSERQFNILSSWNVERLEDFNALQELTACPSCLKFINLASHLHIHCLSLLPHLHTTTGALWLSWPLLCVPELSFSFPGLLLLLQPFASCPGKSCHRMPSIGCSGIADLWEGEGCSMSLVVLSSPEGQGSEAGAIGQSFPAFGWKDQQGNS